MFLRGFKWSKMILTMFFLSFLINKIDALTLSLTRECIYGTDSSYMCPAVWITACHRVVANGHSISLWFVLNWITLLLVIVSIKCNPGKRITLILKAWVIYATSNNIALLLYFSCDDWEDLYIYCVIIIIKSEVRTITHCLGLGYKTMVAAVCLSIFSWYFLYSLR